MPPNPMPQVDDCYEPASGPYATPGQRTPTVRPRFAPRSTRLPRPRLASMRRAARSARSRQTSAGEPDGQAPWSPCSGRGAEHAGHRRITVHAPALGGEPVGAQAVPVALDHQLAAVVAVGALACGVVGVAGVGVADAVGKGDAPGPG